MPAPYAWMRARGLDDLDLDARRVQAERGREAADPAAGDEHAHQRCAPSKPAAGNSSCTIMSGRPCERIA